jgi:hypothetical protein
VDVPPLPQTRLKTVALHLETDTANCSLLKYLIGSWTHTIQDLSLDMSGLGLASVGELFRQCPRLSSLSFVLSTMVDEAGTVLDVRSSSVRRLAVKNDTQVQRVGIKMLCHQKVAS